MNVAGLIPSMRLPRMIDIPLIPPVEKLFGILKKCTPKALISVPAVIIIISFISFDLFSVFILSSEKILLEVFYHNRLGL